MPRRSDGLRWPETPKYPRNIKSAAMQIEEQHRERIALGLIEQRQKISSAYLTPFTDGYYVNLHDSDPKDKGTERNYGPNFSRLATLKKQYDPVNLFRLNANIKPV